jgi:hypothetical protein
LSALERQLNSKAEGALLPGVDAEGSDIDLDIGMGDVEPVVEVELFVAENTAVVRGREVLFSAHEESKGLLLL